MQKVSESTAGTASPDPPCSQESPELYWDRKYFYNKPVRAPSHALPGTVLPYGPGCWSARALPSPKWPLDVYVVVTREGDYGDVKRYAGSSCTAQDAERGDNNHAGRPHYSSGKAQKSGYWHGLHGRPLPTTRPRGAASRDSEADICQDTQVRAGTLQADLQGLGRRAPALYPSDRSPDLSC